MLWPLHWCLCVCVCVCVRACHQRIRVETLGVNENTLLRDFCSSISVLFIIGVAYYVYVLWVFILAFY